MSSSNLYISFQDTAYRQVKINDQNHDLKDQVPDYSGLRFIGFPNSSPGCAHAEISPPPATSCKYRVSRRHDFTTSAPISGTSITKILCLWHLKKGIKCMTEETETSSKIKTSKSMTKKKLYIDK